MPNGIPADALVVLVGPSGSGKSTWARRHAPSGSVLASDDFRAMVAGDAADQSANADAFKVLHAVARARLRRALLTVIDATNLTVGARRALLRLAARSDRAVVAVAFDVSLARCLAQNAARDGRQVPDEVVRRQHLEFGTALARLRGEGYADVIVLGDDDLASP